MSLRIPAGFRWPVEGARFLDLLLPPACAGCGAHLPREGSRPPRRICPRCRTRLVAPAHPRCERCEAPQGTGRPPDRACPRCGDWPAVLRWARTAALLRPPADALVHALKYDGWPELGEEMGALMARIALPNGGSLAGRVLVPVPTTARRLRERGYHQAEVLARALAREGGGHLLPALVREGGGESQVALHPDERRTNVKGAFQLRDSARRRIRGGEVVLVDDVLTTGATAIAAAEALVEGGADGVVLLTFARALPD